MYSADRQSYLRYLLFIPIVLLLLASLHCGRDHRDPLSAQPPADGRGIQLAIALQKSAGIPKIQSVRVVAKSPSVVDSVVANLAIQGNTASGSLDVPAATGWVIAAYAYVGSNVFYKGNSSPVDVVAGQTTPAVRITLSQAVPDIAVRRGMFLTRKPGDSQVLSPESIADGDSVTVNIDYQNNGPVAASGWRHELYLDGQRYRYDNGSILPNGSDVLSFGWTAVEGSHTFEWRLDSDNRVVELDEENNTTAPFQVTVLKKADLIAGQIVFGKAGTADLIDPTSIVDGDAIDIRLDVRNAGPIPAVGWRHELYVDGTLYRSGDESSAPNSSKVLSFPWSATAGSHALEWRLDTANRVAEQDEANGIARLSFSVLKPADLVATQLLFTRAGGGAISQDDIVSQRDTLDVRLVLSNAGPVEAPAWRYELYVDNRLYYYGETSVAANSSETVFVEWIAATGTHAFEWKLDTTNKVREQDEGNNAIAGSFAVLRQPDLVADRIYFTRPLDTTVIPPDAILEGQKVEVHLAYRNAGGAPALRWRYELVVDGQLFHYGEESALGNSSKELAVVWVPGPGNHTLEWKLDTAGKIAEENEADNAITQVVTILQQAELVADKLYLTLPGEDKPLPLDAILDGDKVDVRLSFRNLGPVDANGWRQELYVDRQLYHSGDESISSASSGVLLASWTATAGAHTFEWRLDTADMIPEQNETNGSATLTVAVARRADLVASSIGPVRASNGEIVPPNAMEEGDTLEIQLQYRNLGQVDPSAWRYNVSLDGSSYQSGDASGGSGSVSVRWVAVAGQHTVTFTVDASDQIKESDETNNSTSLSFTVRSRQITRGIIAGKGVDKLRLGMSPQEIFAILGPAEGVGPTLHILYPSQGFELALDDSGNLNLIIVYPPYSGATLLGIQFGNTLQDITAKYGVGSFTQVDIGLFSLDYPARGISFILDISSTCVAIAVYAPTGSAKIVPGKAPSLLRGASILEFLREQKARKPEAGRELHGK